VVTAHFDADSGERWVTVARAGPVILVGDELMGIMAAGPFPAEEWPWSRFDVTNRGCDPGDEWKGCRLVINARDRTVIYVIGGRHDQYTHLACWPD